MKYISSIYHWAYTRKMLCSCWTFFSSKAVLKDSIWDMDDRCIGLSFLKIWEHDTYLKHHASNWIRACMWNILRNIKDVTSTINKRTKCLLLENYISLERVFPKELVGVNLNKFKFHKIAIILRWKIIQISTSCWVCN